MKFSIVAIAAFVAAATAIPVSVVYDHEFDLQRRQDSPAVDPPAEDIVSGPDASVATMTDANGNVVAFDAANVFTNPNAGK